MAVITLPGLLRDRLGDAAAEALANVFREIDVGARVESISIIEERFERRLSEESGKLRIEIEKLRSEIKIENEKFRAEVKTEIAGVNANMAIFKAEMIKWMFLFWIGQLVSLTALFKFFLK
jgi:hypothetical protein